MLNKNLQRDNIDCDSVAEILQFFFYCKIVAGNMVMVMGASNIFLL